MENEEIRERINSFARWHYQFDLKGNLTPIADKNHINRHQQRKRYFFEPVVQLMGGSLKGKRVLDLGCNAGFWSLAAIEAGCDFVLGVDARQMHVDQATFVFQVKEIEESRYRFVQGDMFEYDFQPFGPFDIVFCLGLMYHISKPMEMLETISKVNSDLLIIDTSLSQAPGSFLEIGRDDLERPLSAVDYEVVMFPTKRAVLELVRQFGYSAVMLKPQFSDYTGAIEYKIGVRRAFLCAKQTSLAHLPVAVEPVNARTQRMDAIRWATAPLTHFVRRLTRFVRRRLFHAPRP